MFKRIRIRVAQLYVNLSRLGTLEILKAFQDAPQISFSLCLTMDPDHTF